MKIICPRCKKEVVNDRFSQDSFALYWHLMDVHSEESSVNDPIEEMLQSYCDLIVKITKHIEYYENAALDFYKKGKPTDASMMRLIEAEIRSFLV